MVEELSPGLSAFWGTAFLIFIMLTQRPLIAAFRGEQALSWRGLREGFDDLIAAFQGASRNMTSVGIATATAGIIVGTVSLTGIGLVMTEIVETVSGGNLIIMLAMTAVICLILGMGMPTTASYVVVATLMAPVLVELAAENDLAVPLVAVHLFVFYFGLMADVTPPVGLAAYAAAAISGADPVKTGIQAFRYEIRTGLLPFIFIFNTELLLIDVGGVGHFLVVVVCSVVAMGCFVAATQNWLLTRNRWYETVALLLICFTLFRPGFWLDQLQAPFVDATGDRAHRGRRSDPAGVDLALPRQQPVARRRRCRKAGAADDALGQDRERAPAASRAGGRGRRRRQGDACNACASAARRQNTVCRRATKSPRCWCRRTGRTAIGSPSRRCCCSAASFCCSAGGNASRLRRRNGGARANAKRNLESDLHARRFRAAGFGFPFPAQDGALQGLEFRLDGAVEQRVLAVAQAHVDFRPIFRPQPLHGGGKQHVLFLVHVPALVVDEVLHDVMKGLAAGIRGRREPRRPPRPAGSSAAFRLHARSRRRRRVWQRPASRIFSFSKTISSFG